MESVTCLVCGVEASIPLYEGRDRLLGGDDVFQLRRCQRCGLIYINPRPTQAEIQRYYPAAYEPFTRQDQLDGWYNRLRYRVAIARMCGIAAQGQAPGRLLDVGCGSGEFLLGMQERGWEAHGLDISAVAVELARQKGLNVFLGQLPDTDYEAESFDLITMWDVLEHLHDPRKYLNRVSQLLKPGGRFVVTLPNPHSIDFGLFGPLWTGLDVPRHLYVFARAPLLELFRQVGLTLVSSRCAYGGQRVSTWSLEWLIDERLPGTWLGRALKKTIYSPFWYWAWRAYYLVIDWLGQGSSITYVCQRAEETP